MAWLPTSLLINGSSIVLNNFETLELADSIHLLFKFGIPSKWTITALPYASLIEIYEKEKRKEKHLITQESICFLSFVSNVKLMIFYRETQQESMKTRFAWKLKTFIYINNWIANMSFIITLRNCSCICFVEKNVIEFSAIIKKAFYFLKCEQK